MKIYIVSPGVINLDAWESLLGVLNIETVVDLVRYKPTAINPVTCFNKVFDDVGGKINYAQMLPYNFNSLEVKERVRISRKVVEGIFDELIEIGCQYYDSAKEHASCCDNYEEYLQAFEEFKDSRNVLILSTSYSFDLLKYGCKYFYRAIREVRFPELVDRNHEVAEFVEFVQLNFWMKESYLFNSSTTDFQEGFYYKQCGFGKYEKCCETMDDVLLSLKENYNLSERELFTNDDKYAAALKARVEDLRFYQKQEELRDEESWTDDWIDLGRDELRGMSESFPGWEWNID